MTITEALHKATATLAKAKITSPRIEATLLLGHALKKSKEFIFAHPEHELATAQERRFFALIKRRAKREPFAYITGHKEFYGLDFLVNRHTLIPRPETELLIETTLQEIHLHGNQPPGRILDAAIIDVGTGSGALAITLAKLFPYTTVYATDTSAAALAVARKNAKRHHGVRIRFKKGNLLQPFLNQRVSQSTNQLFIVANLPYLPTKTWRAAEPEVVRYEPRGALDGGPDGLKHYRQLVKQIKQLLVTSYELRVTLYLEIDPRESKPLSTLIRKTSPRARVQIKKDYASRDRVLIATLQSVQHLSPQSTSYRH